MSMASSSIDSIPGRFEVKATASDHFSWLRTRLSIERTMMSWVRTASALIGFGFTIVQFFDRLQEMPGAAPAYFPHASRYLGLSLIFCGVMALVISIWEYQWGLRYLWSGNFAVIAERPARENKLRCSQWRSSSPSSGYSLSSPCCFVSYSGTSGRKHRLNKQFRTGRSIQGASHGKV